jgi:GTA TIM-barrel-like domain/Putative phage tail protein
MATLVLQVAGTAIGTYLGGPIGGAIGSAIGATAGNYMDRSLMSGGGKHMEGPRIINLNGITAAEGAPIPRVYGRARLGGHIIWATSFEEVANRQKVKSGGKGSPSTPTQTTYSYYANVAIGLCEGEIAFVRRVWVDGYLLDLTKVTMRVYRGTETQQPDPLIVAKQGRGDIPAFKGLAYVVFERLPLADYGNRLPVLTFEVVRPVDGLAQMIKAVDLIPGSTEFGCDTTLVNQYAGFGVSTAQNRNQTTHSVDLLASLDALQALCPNLTNVALVVAWFGDDLRAGNCTIRPKVDLNAKTTTGAEWSVAGLTRAAALQTSRSNGVAAYGSTPSDSSVIHCIAALKSRGLKVMLYPFVMMDVPANNTLPDPYSVTVGQPAYPWRGRISCNPAIGQTGSVDGTLAAETQVNSFFGQVTVANFNGTGSVVAPITNPFSDGNDGSLFNVTTGMSVPYSGANEWSFRRHILHYAALAKTAGGVDAFLIGSELIGLTRVRGAAGNFLAVTHLIALAGDVRAILGSTTKISYAADWTEYGSYVIGSQVRFPLDALWANANINFVGIDYYPPLSDWRGGRDHLDASLANSIYSLDYLTSRFKAGEAYDWYYESEADRNAQIRTSITDGAANKPWIYRAKDLKNWWSNPHFERLNGAELGAPTAWIPQSKPIWLTEFGVPAVDKGSNAPNVFSDPKSSESAFPPFSIGVRDDLIQARSIEALIRNYDPAHPNYVAGSNPTSNVYGGLMIDTSRIHIWAWDARPFPAFPHSDEVWADGTNWITGHWLNGRLEGTPVDRLLAKIMVDFQLGSAQFSDVDGFIDGYVIDRPMAARSAIESLLALFGCDAVTSAGTIGFAGRKAKPVLALNKDDFVPDRNGGILHQNRAQETELAHEISLTFVESSIDFRTISVASRRLSGASKREIRLNTAAMMPREAAQKLVDISLQESWIGRDTIDFSLRPGLLGLQIGDVIRIDSADTQKLFRIVKITDSLERKISAKTIEPSLYDEAGSGKTLLSLPTHKTNGPPFAIILDLPAANETPTALQYMAIHADPWQGGYTVWRSRDGGSFEAFLTLNQSATVGKTLNDLVPATPWLFDRSTKLTVQIVGGYLASIEETSSLAGTNTLGVRGADGAWEIITFASAALTGVNQWELSGFTRGLKGSEAQAQRIAPAGSTVVLIDVAVVETTSSMSDIGTNWIYRIAASNTDYTDPNAITLTSTVKNVALLPLSPVQPRAVRGGAGITITWIRRTRIGGDTWETLEVPLSEGQESYLLEIMNGANVVRSVTLAAPVYQYNSSDELSYFGTAQSQLTIKVRQISSDAGAGLPLLATLIIG